MGRGKAAGADRFDDGGHDRGGADNGGVLVYADGYPGMQFSGGVGAAGPSATDSLVEQSLGDVDQLEVLALTDVA